VICAAGSGLAPADKKLYALRDVTGTVEAIPLIASSIMSKKIAEGTDSLVLDVKFGSGAFMHDVARARELARTMVELGLDSGVATTALLTDMNVPLGRAIGNANEVRESVEVLAGGGPADVIELTLALAREMLALAGQPDSDVEAALSDGRAMDTWRAMIRAQDGDPDAALPQPRETQTVTSPSAGVGAGRARAEDPVVHAAGIDLHVKPGDVVAAGQPVFTLLGHDKARFDRALAALEGAWDVGPVAPPASPLVLERITG
jgi:thymidine phosphorylase